MSDPLPASAPAAAGPGHARPGAAWVCRDPGRLIAFGLGSGLLRPGPGTWGTLLAWAIWRVVQPAAPDWTVGVFLLVGFAYGCWACHRVGRELGRHDHGGMVWDEMVAFWLVLWVAPAGWPTQALAFALFRLFDITKPPPIRTFERRFRNGFGVMGDDIIAAGATLLVLALLARLGGWP